MANRQNYFARKELNKQKRIDAGLVSDHFPKILRLVIRMIYYQKFTNPILMVRTVNFSPSSYAYFNMECMMKGCLDGGFDLTSVIARQIRTHKKSVKGKMVCSGKHDSLTTGHASVSYEITVQYSRKSK